MSWNDVNTCGKNPRPSTPLVGIPANQQLTKFLYAPRDTIVCGGTAEQALFTQLFF